MYGGYLSITPLARFVPDYFRGWMDAARGAQKEAQGHKSDEAMPITALSVDVRDDPSAWEEWLDYIATVLDGEG